MVFLLGVVGYGGLPMMNLMGGSLFLPMVLRIVIPTMCLWSL